jgi:6-pyruvoyltetrahydropterin/6-carboxytetrahydropterin synthase
VIEVSVAGEPDPVTGMIVDLKQMKEVIERKVVSPMDHRHLNHEVPPFDKLIPTAENLAKEIWTRLEPELATAPGKLHCVRLYETDDLYVDYWGPSA